MEHEAEGQLDFLDLNITKTKDGFSTDAFRKETVTGLGLNFNSFVPLILNPIQTIIVVRACNICSYWNSFDKEIHRLRQYFTSSGYSLKYSKLD